MSGKNRLSGEVAKKANELLPAVVELFEKFEIPFCLDGGTLLGIARENRLLPWDNDLDFFVRGVDAPQIAKLKWRLLLLGCRLKKRKALENYGPIPKGAPRLFKIQTLKKYDGHRVIIDLIFKYPDEKDYHWTVGSKPSVHKKISRHYYDKFEQINYLGKEYPTPCELDSYLTSRYGDWRTPIKEWDFRKDDNALTE